MKQLRDTIVIESNQLVAANWLWFNHKITNLTTFNMYKLVPQLFNFYLIFNHNKHFNSLF